jgi:uncharacterized protein (DUF2267 family)
VITHGKKSMQPDGERTQTETGGAERFLRDIEAAMMLPENVSAAAAATAVTCTLTARLTGGEAGHALQALPLPVHELLRRCDRHESASAEPFGREDFLRRVAEHLGVREADAERVVLAVFSALRVRLPVQEVENVASQLPKGLERLWRQAVPGLAAPAGGEPLALMPQAAHVVLDEIEQSGALPPVLTGAQAFSAVMCTLEQWLSGDQARRVAQGMPVSIRPLIERCAAHRDNRPAQGVHAEEFTLSVAEHLGVDTAQAEEITRAVFAAVQHLLISEREKEEVARELPEDLEDLWRSPRLDTTS